ncbi:MAG: hypothetical protein AMXMBFR84_23780 [Candidatus Hydrogenedentota bacterium]
MTDYSPSQGPGNSHHAHIEVDAVCEVCETVNPQDTLLCKSCGNNLRDQRMRRLHIEAVVMQEERIQPRKLLRGLLVALGLLTMVWAAVNFVTGDVDKWMTQQVAASGSTSTAADPMEFWQGTEGAAFDALIQEVRSVQLTEADLRSLSAVPISMESLPGFYVLKSRSGDAAPIVGQAIVQQDGDGFRFAAIISGQAEARGYAKTLGAASLKASFIGVQVRSESIDAYGAATLTPQGLIECQGFPSSVDPTSPEARPYTIYAFKLPR